MVENQLFSLTGADFELPSYIDRNQKLITKPANDIPMVVWPDGRWCLPANLYMLTQYAGGLSRKTYGGTLRTNASKLSHLCRYSYNAGRDFIELTDNDFTQFISALMDERKAKNPERKKRNSKTVITIGRACLDFLASIAALYDDEYLIGPMGRIVAEQRTAEIPIGDKYSGRRTIVRKYWHHRSFPTPSPEVEREPISSKNVEKLRAAVLPTSTSMFQRKRRYVMLKLLEITGGRRIEVVHLTVQSVREAAKMAEPKLKLMTAKQPGGREEFRLLPIARHDLDFLIEFIEVNRSAIVRKTCGVGHDDGYVLVSVKTGLRLQPNTITQEVRILALAALIVERIGPHLFRHRFITKLFVAIIEQHNFENADDFRRALLDAEGIKVQIMQWTGHKDIASLTRYIHLAFAEIVKLKKTLNVVRIKRTIESFKASIDQARLELGRRLAGPEKDVAQLMYKMAESLLIDLDMASEED